MISGYRECSTNWGYTIIERVSGLRLGIPELEPFFLRFNAMIHRP